LIRVRRFRLRTGAGQPGKDAVDSFLELGRSPDQVRVLDVVIEPGTREPEHTHQAPSVMIIDRPAGIRYYADGTLQFESRARPDAPPGPRVRWMEPEGPHFVENIDQHRYHAIRVELKQYRPA
jgi:hypothetical protein